MTPDDPKRCYGSRHGNGENPWRPATRDIGRVGARRGSPPARAKCAAVAIVCRSAMLRPAGDAPNDHRAHSLPRSERHPAPPRRRAVGRTGRARPLVASPQYSALPSSAKAKAMRDIIAKSREAATKAILVANPGLVKGVARHRLEQVTGP